VGSTVTEVVLFRKIRWKLGSFTNRQLFETNALVVISRCFFLWETLPRRTAPPVFYCKFRAKRRYFFGNRRNPLFTQGLRKTAKSYPNVTGVAKSYRHASFYRKVDCFAIRVFPRFQSVFADAIARRSIAYLWTSCFCNTQKYNTLNTKLFQVFSKIGNFRVKNVVLPKKATLFP